MKSIMAFNPRMVIRAVTILSFFLPCLLPTAKGQHKTNQDTAQVAYYNLSLFDITKINSFHSQELQMFGIRLGISIDQVKNTLRGQDSIIIKQDKFNDKRFYLYEDNHSSKGHPLLYLKWPENDPSTLQEIIFYPGCRKYFVGNTKKLFTNATLNFSPSTGQTFFGYPNGKKNLLRVPSQNIRHTAYYYTDEGYEIIKLEKGDKTKFAFGIFLKEPL